MTLNIDSTSKILILRDGLGGFIKPSGGTTTKLKIDTKSARGSCLEVKMLFMMQCSIF